MLLLLLAEAMLLFGGLIVAVYVRLGAVDAEETLLQRNGFYKAALATVFCLASFYLFDLYDLVVIHDRRELALLLMVAWRPAIHWVLGHPDLGERILIVGSGPFAIEIARETLGRPDAGFRVIGFVDSDPALVGQSLINPKVIGLTSELRSIVKKENIDRIVVAIGDRRGQFPTQ